MKKTKNNSLLFLIGFVFYTVLIGIIILNIQKGDAVLYLNQQHNNFLNPLFAYTTNLGDGIFYAIVVIVLLVFISFYEAILAGLCFGLTSAMAQIVKKLIFTDAPRPKLFFEEQNIPIHFVEGVTVHAHNSFPSGHTTTAFSVFFLLAWLINRKFWSLIFLFLAILAGISRVYLVQHFLVDTFFGAFLGTSITALVIWIFEKYLPKEKYPKLERKLI